MRAESVADGVCTSTVDVVDGASAWDAGPVADDPELTERVRRALAGEPDVVERRMFGSVGFVVRGTLRLGVGSHPDHAVLLRVAAADLPTALDRAGAKPAVMRGRQMRGWLFLERAAVEADEDLAAWVALALASVP